MLTQIRLKYAFNNLKKELQKIRDKNFNEKEVMEFLFSKKGSLITPWQFEEEFYQLLVKYKSLNPKYVMEIGTANGGTLFSHCKLADDNATIISVDLPNGTFGGGYPDWKISIYEKFAKTKQRLELIRADSHDSSTEEKVKQILNNNLLDYLFIDGDHTYEGVKKDYEIYRKYVKKGGVVVFHDIVEHNSSTCKVDEFWNELKLSNPDYIEYIKQPQERKFGIGIINN